ncbi:UbiD family decarboxylase domain-containing protein [Streptomyces sp. NPDC090442]|uniref:UbiD family decarboxylase domain-containing protein n=1 Tax=Streptomyces sp. NPDC090442 TaxID=3365962 RepID=UPI00382D4FEE
MTDERPGLSLRAALREARGREPGAYHEHDEPHDPTTIGAHYAAHYAGAPATPSGRSEDIAVYTRVAGGAVPVAVGAYGDAERLRRWLPGLPRRANADTAAALTEAFRPPVHLDSSPFTHRTTGDQVDLGALPALHTTPRDAGPYLTTGLLHAHDPATGRTATAVHRMLVRDARHVVIWMLPSRRLRAMHRDARDRGERLPVTINIGAPPAAMLASAVGSAFLPPGTDKVQLAGALAGAPLVLAPAVTQPVSAFATSEIVLEGYLDDTTADEALPGREPAGSLPEVLGNDGRGAADLPVITVTAVTTREDPVFQAVIGPGREQSLILGLAGELAVALSGVGGELLRDAHYAPAGGGMFLLVAQVRKDSAAVDGQLPALAGEIFERHPFVKLLVFVDEDVDPSSPEDLLWALTTRSNLSVDAAHVEGFARIGLDPSQTVAWDSARGRSAGGHRSYVDATAPYAMRGAVRRSFLDPLEG